jgi:membrane-bound serine protease (ClpP class)
MISEALVLGMIDRGQELIWTQIQTGEKPNVVTESRVVLPAEFDRLLQSKVVMPRHETLKSPGVDGVFTGRKARTFNFLAQHTAESRSEVARLYRLPNESMREDLATGIAPNAMVIRVQDEINPILEQFMHRQIARAVEQGVNLLIFEIDSPGGYLEESQILAMDIARLEDQKVRTIAYVPKRALSGAAMIALGCDEIYLNANSQFGDAGPIEMRKGGHFFHASEKILSSLEAHLQTLADLKHRPGGLLRAMANRHLNVYEATHRETGELSFLTDEELHGGNGQWVKGRRVPETGQNAFLTVNGRRAHELRLAETPVTSFDELKQRLGLASVGSVPVSEATWVDTLIFILNSSTVTGMLFMAGIFCIYLEAHFPSGFFGICSAVAFGVFFWSRWQATAGWLEVILFLIGVACIGLEIFVVPGFGVFGISGGLLVLLSLVLASQTFVFPSSTGELATTAKSLITVGGAIVGTFVLGALSARLLPRIPLFDAMVLSPPGNAGTPNAPRLAPGMLGEESSATGSLLERSLSLVGRQGVAQTSLRPSGKVVLGEELIDVVSAGEFLKAGTPVEVISVHGMRVVVRESTGKNMPSSESG